MKQYLIYLAGPITGVAFDQTTNWRREVEAALRADSRIGDKAICLSPMRGKPKEKYILADGKVVHSHETDPLGTSRGIMTRDRWDATRCDLLFVNFLGAQKVSIGTVMEVAWADLKRTPIVVAMEPDNVHQHAMLKEASGFILPTLEQAIDVAAAILSTGN